MPTRRHFLKQTALAVGAAATQHALGSSLASSKKEHQKKDGRAAGAMAGTALVDVTGPRSLRAHAAARGLLVGCAVVPEHLDSEPDYAATVAAQSSILVCENAMKWAAIHPAADKYNFVPADDAVVFALSHDQKMRGHNLCWHEALPPWFSGTVNRDNARQVLADHIRTVASRYAGKLHSWDVVNEAIWVKDGRVDGLRVSPWLELIGPDYIELAFRAAHQADPSALLTYNDYGIELDTPEQTDKRAQVLMLVRRLKARGVPIDAVGIQSHLTAGDAAPGAGLISFVRELRHMGLQVLITELDIDDHKLSGSLAERDSAVAALYRDYLNIMLNEPNLTAVLTWGITDRYTWLTATKPRPDGKPQRPLPFDPDYHPAPAFFAMRDALEARAGSQPGVLPVAPGVDANPYAPFTPKAPAPKPQPQ